MSLLETRDKVTMLPKSRDTFGGGIIDDQPLATKVSHIFWDFPYDRLSSNDNLVAFLLKPHIVITILLLYLASQPVVKQLTFKLNLGQSLTFQRFVAFHNLALTIFSIIGFTSLAKIIIPHIIQHGVQCLFHGVDDELWARGAGRWTVIAIFSKYYEFIDTWILICKGKKPSFLQVFHHVGVVLVGWMGFVSRSGFPMLLSIFVNLLIHTIMYAYFFVKTLWPELHILGVAQILTCLQIGQFLLVLATSTKIIFMKTKVSEAAWFALAICDLYLIGLVSLFLAFARKKYGKKKQT